MVLSLIVIWKIDTAVVTVFIKEIVVEVLGALDGLLLHGAHGDYAAIMKNEEFRLLLGRVAPSETNFSVMTHVTTWNKKGKAKR